MLDLFKNIKNVFADLVQLHWKYSTEYDKVVNQVQLLKKKKFIYNNNFLLQ